MQTQTPPAPPGWYDDPAGPGGNRYWDGDQWTDHYQPPPSEPPPSERPTKPKKPWHRRWWVWVLGGLLVLTIIGALIPADESADSEPSAAAESRKTEPTVKLTVDQADSSVVRKDTARITGSVQAANAGGERVKGVVTYVWINGFGGRTITVKPDDTFEGRVHLPRVGANEIELTADWAGVDAADTVTLTLIRRQSAAELAAVRERRAARREARRQELINSAQTIDYDQLMKNPESFAGDPVKYSGQIFQIQEDPAGGGMVLLAVTDEGYGFWSDNIWVNYKGKVQGAEDDMLTVYGTVVGSKSYETQIGGETYVPEINAQIVEE